MVSKENLTEYQNQLNEFIHRREQEKRLCQDKKAFDMPLRVGLAEVKRYKNEGNSLCVYLTETAQYGLTELMMGLLVDGNLPISEEEKRKLLADAFEKRAGQSGARAASDGDTSYARRCTDDGIKMLAVAQRIRTNEFTQ